MRAQLPADGAEAPAPTRARPLDLLGWLATAADQGPRPGFAQDAGGGADATAAVRGLVGPWQGTLPTNFLEEAAAWLRAHVDAVTRRGGTRHWQWSLALLTWMMERCGVIELLRDQPTVANELLAEAGFAAAARRQAPFTAWARGQEHCSPGCRLPGGEVASLVTAARLGRTCLATETGTEEALRRLLLGASHLTLRPPEGDVVMGEGNGGQMRVPSADQAPASRPRPGEGTTPIEAPRTCGPSLFCGSRTGARPLRSQFGNWRSSRTTAGLQPSPPPPLPGCRGNKRAGPRANSGRARARGASRGCRGGNRCERHYWDAQLHGTSGPAPCRAPPRRDRVLAPEPGRQGGTS